MIRGVKIHDVLGRDEKGIITFDDSDFSHIKREYANDTDLLYLKSGSVYTLTIENSNQLINTLTGFKDAKKETKTK